MKINFLLLVAVLILCYFTAPYFGSWYDKFSPQYGSLFFDKADGVFIMGLFLSYVFLVSFLFEIFGTDNKKRWTMWLLLPAVLLWIFTDIYYIYLPIILGLVGFILAKLINIIVKKLKRSTSINIKS